MDEQAFSPNENPSEEADREEAAFAEIIEDSSDNTGSQSNGSAYDMAIITDEATGEQWCTIKYAAKLTGLSYSTIRRYTKDGRLQFRTEDSPFGKVNYVKVSDIENYKAAYDLDKAKRGVRAGDYQFEMTSFIRTAFAPAVSDLQSSIDTLQTTQEQLTRTVSEETEENRRRMDEIKAQNEALLSKINELSEVIAKQEAAISEMKAAEDKKGFFGKLFKK